MKPACLMFATILSVHCAILAAQSLLQPVPYLDQPLIPISRAPRGPGFTLTVNGVNFVPASVVMWDGRPRQTQYVSPAQLRAKIPASDIARVRTASITVVNPEPGGGISNVVFLPVRRRAVPDGITWKYVAAPPPEVIVAADFNNDGKLDLAVTDNYEIPILTVLIGNGDGTFQPPVNYAIDGIAGDIVVGDFNRDGNLDLIVSGDHIEELLGNGDGTFQSPRDLGFPRSCLAVGDFNRDGNLDLVFGQDPLMIALGNGDGTFQPPAPVSFLFDVLALSVGDINKDGILDIVASTNEGAQAYVAVSLGNGDGTFQQPISAPTQFDTLNMIAADMNGDGKLDLVVDSDEGSPASIFFGKGDGSFLPRVEFGFPGGPFGLVVGDFNADGKIDLATVNDTWPVEETFVTLLPGKGDGKFRLEIPFRLLRQGLGPNFGRGLVAGYFGGNGGLDLVVATDDGVELWLQSP